MAPKVEPGEARFGPELDWEKPWRAKVAPGEARFGPELDWEKPWRDQVFGAKMSETNGNRRPFFF